MAELRINAWVFYDAKRRYTPKQEIDNAGKFLHLIPKEYPAEPSKSRSSKKKNAENNAIMVSIELQTPTGTLMRINGNLTGQKLKNIIIAPSVND